MFHSRISAAAPALLHGQFCACHACAVALDPLVTPRARRTRRRLVGAGLTCAAFAIALQAPAVGLALGAGLVAYGLGLGRAARDNVGTHYSVALSARHIRRGLLLRTIGAAELLLAGMAIVDQAAAADLATRTETEQTIFLQGSESSIGCSMERNRTPLADRIRRRAFRCRNATSATKLLQLADEAATIRVAGREVE